jgi:choice-of-anchor A domain-containing protein
MDPNDFTILSSGEEVTILGTAEFYGQVLAPDAQVTIGGEADWYGAVIGETVKMHGNFNFHVDESVPFAKPWYDLPPPMLVH